MNKVGSGGGCILAHCMGLGKTLTTICFTLTLLSSPQLTAIRCPLAVAEQIKNNELKKIESKKLKKQEKADLKLLREGMGNENENEEKNGENKDEKNDDDESDSDEDNASIGLPQFMLDTPLKQLFHKILVLAPVNTLKNWQDEYIRWTPSELRSHTNVRLLSSGTSGVDRMKLLRSWNNEGGVLILGYELFRIMTGNVQKVTKKNNGVSTNGTDKPLTADQTEARK